MNYPEKLRDPRWQRKRLHILDRDLWACTCCGSIDENLQVHHKYYVKKKEPWDYDDNCLETLCSTCHFLKEHYIKKGVKDEVPFLVIKTRWGNKINKIILVYCYVGATTITRILNVNLDKELIRELSSIPVKLKPRKLLRRYEKKGR